MIKIFGTSWGKCWSRFAPLHVHYSRAGKISSRQAVRDSVARGGRGFRFPDTVTKGKCGKFVHYEHTCSGKRHFIIIADGAVISLAFSFPVAIHQVEEQFRVAATPLDSGLGRDEHLYYGHLIFFLHALRTVAESLIRLQPNVVFAELLFRERERGSKYRCIGYWSSRRKRAIV